MKVNIPKEMVQQWGVNIPWTDEDITKSIHYIQRRRRVAENAIIYACQDALAKKKKKRKKK